MVFLNFASGISRWIIGNEENRGGDPFPNVIDLKLKVISTSKFLYPLLEHSYLHTLSLLRY
jgi:hypothetical protein